MKFIWKEKTASNERKRKSKLFAKSCALMLEGEKRVGRLYFYFHFLTVSFV